MLNSGDMIFRHVKALLIIKSLELNLLARILVIHFLLKFWLITWETLLRSLMLWSFFKFRKFPSIVYIFHIIIYILLKSHQSTYHFPQSPELLNKSFCRDLWTIFSMIWLLKFPWFLSIPQETHLSQILTELNLWWHSNSLLRLEL